MDDKNAAKILDDTFNNEFDFERFSNFIGELFNHFSFIEDPNNPGVRKTQVLQRRKEYKDFVEKIERLGNYKDSNNDTIEVFIIKLKKNSSRDRARTMQRNIIANYLENFGKAALVAFYGDDPTDWRFSFVKMVYDLIKDKKGIITALPDLTPAKRYSFLVGQNEPNHTCKSQFIELIKEENVDPLLYQIENAFSIEKVTKDFFKEYKNLYLDLKESLDEQIEQNEDIWQDFENKQIKSPDFAKKLMGQIVFIYFLQKKGWLGVKKGNEWGTGPKDFLRRLYNGKFTHYKNFFNDILEPLFYEALAIKQNDDYYPSFNCKIPFLNGGLFEPINDYNWKNTRINLDNKIFKEILDTFDLYNFTVKEDEPLEKEVAVDPEMLGKVFENLLEIEDRKSKGAFYTPREIVHYMCQESLINYLKTNSDYPHEDLENFIHFADFYLDDLIREIIDFGRIREDRELGIPKSIRENPFEINELLMKIKVVDPAVGSGAFPVGMMNEIIKAKSILSLFSGKTLSNYELKLQTIKNCLYGVDIDSSSVDITKLRFWLSLIVDEGDVTNIDPLPNLDHKIMCGNSLLEEFKGIKLFDDNLLLKIPEDYSEEIKEIQNEIDNLHRELGEIFTGKIQNENIKNEIQNKIKKLKRKKKEMQKTGANQYNQFTLDQEFNKRVKESQLKIKELKKLQKQFFKEQDASLKKKYRDKIEKIEWELIEETLKEEGNEEAIKNLDEYKTNKSKPFFLWKLYFAEVYQRDNPGFDVVIANPPYGIVFDDHIKKTYEEKFESFHRNNDIYIAFYENSLSLLRYNGTLVFITPNTFLNGDYFQKWREILTKRTVITKIHDYKNIPIFDDPTVFVSVLSCIKTAKITYPYIFEMRISKDSLDEFFVEIVEIEKGSQEKLKAKNPILKKVLKKSDIDVIDNIFFVKDVGFNYWTKGRGKKRGGNSIGKRVLYKGEIKDSRDIPFLKGRNIQKYQIDPPENYLKHNYFDYLDKEVDTFRFSEDFLKINPKLVYRQTSNRIIAAIDFNSYYLDKTVHLIVPKKGQNLDLKYILALLNSKLFNYFYEFISQEIAGRTFAQVKATYIKQLPVKKIVLSEQKIFVNLVDQILELTKKEDHIESDGKKAKIKQLMDTIDILIYDLYDLTPKDQQIIEEFNQME